MRYFITKYALSNGALSELDMEPPAQGEAYVYDRRPGHWNQFIVGRDAFTDRGEAVKAANAARDKKVASLATSIQKLRAMQFGDGK